MTTFEAGNTLAGKYRLERPIASGAMGTVWVAIHHQLNKKVAVKQMSAALVDIEETRQRFEREAKAAAQITSHHIVNVFDVGVEDGVPYIVMELLDGEDLQTRLHRERRLPIPVAANLMVQVCKALQQAHAVGIVHRDIKPANIFLARDVDGEMVKVLDFGIAKMNGPGVGTALTKAGTLVGSPSYMSPEQVRNREIDARSDLWSLGVVFFEAITGQLPFPGNDVGDVLVQICSAPIPIPSRLVPELPPSIDAFFRSALARDRDERFENARAFAAALSALVAQLGVSSYPQAIPPSEPRPSPEPVPSGSGPRMAVAPPPPTSGAVNGATLLLSSSALPPPAAITLSPHVQATSKRPPSRLVAVAVVLSAVLALGGLGTFMFLRRATSEATTAAFAASSGTLSARPEPQPSAPVRSAEPAPSAMPGGPAPSASTAGRSSPKPPSSSAKAQDKRAPSPRPYDPTFGF